MPLAEGSMDWLDWLEPSKIKKQSRWHWKTCWTAGVGVGLFAGSGGSIALYDPAEKEVDFWYGGIGGGLSGKLKLPVNLASKVPSWIDAFLKSDKSGAVGPGPFPSWGWMFILSKFDKDELAMSDIQGTCAFVEIGGGLVGGVSVVAMLVGLDTRYLPLAVVNVVTIQPFLNTANGLLLMAGVSVGLQAGAGISVQLGYLR